MAEFSAQIIQDALNNLSECKLSITPSEQAYARGYPALVALGSRLAPDDENSVIALAYAAYGWMPTILKRLPDPEQSSAIGQLVGELRKSELSKVPELLTKQKGCLQVINGSVVGVSKFLHFCVPQKVPIWDSRIGKIFDCKWEYQVNNIDNFLSYVGSMAEFQNSDIFCVPEKLLTALDENGIDVKYISALRIVELCLFLEGKSR
jgi:hypothetical protein